MSSSFSVSIIPAPKKDKLETPEEAALHPVKEMTPEQQERKRKFEMRLQEMSDYKSSRMEVWRKVIKAYEAEREVNPNDPTRESFTLPYAHIYLDARLSEEAENPPNFIYTAVEASDSWKVNIIDEVRKHVENRVDMRSKWQTWIFHKNLFGVGIIRTGYQLVMRTIKERIVDLDSEEEKYQEKRVPMYDDLFVRNVSPFNFYVDPNAQNMNEAEDCAEVEILNWNTFQESYAKDKRYTNIDSVRPGAYFNLPDSSSVFSSYATKDQVVKVSYYNKLLDEQIEYFNGVECRYSPLPDDHKELPYADLHNHAHFGHSNRTVTTTTNTFSVASSRETFWSKGDVEWILDPIEIRTGFFRAAADGARLANTNIIVTQGTYVPETTTADWYNGKPAVGAMGRMDVMPLGRVDVSYQAFAQELDTLMTMILGVDPQVLTDTKTKTATETAIKRETMMKRIRLNFLLNENLGVLRFGRLMPKNIQQYYPIPELVRLTGNEEIDNFKEVIKDSSTGKPILGKRYRHIRSTKKFLETSRKGKFYMAEDEAGAQSFLARPEYIRSSEIDVRVEPESTLGASRELDKVRSLEAVQMVSQLVQLVPTGVIEADSIPNMKYVVEKWIRAMGWDAEKALGKTEPEEEVMRQGIISGSQNQQQESLTPLPARVLPSSQQSPQRIGQNFSDAFAISA